MRYLSCNGWMLLGMFIAELALPLPGVSAGLTAATVTMFAVMFMGMTAGMWTGWWSAEWIARSLYGSVRTGNQHT